MQAYKLLLLANVVTVSTGLNLTGYMYVLNQQQQEDDIYAAITATDLAGPTLLLTWQLLINA